MAFDRGSKLADIPEKTAVRSEYKCRDLEARVRVLWLRMGRSKMTRR